MNPPRANLNFVVMGTSATAENPKNTTAFASPSFKPPQSSRMVLGVRNRSVQGRRQRKKIRLRKQTRASDLIRGFRWALSWCGERFEKIPRVQSLKFVGRSCKKSDKMCSCCCCFHRILKKKEQSQECCIQCTDLGPKRSSTCSTGRPQLQLPL